MTMIIVVLVLVACILAYLVVKGKNDNTATQTTSQTTTTRTSDTSPTVVGDPATAQADYVQSAYDTYLKSVKSLNPNREGGLESIKTYLTPELYADIKSRYAGGSQKDEILCSYDSPTKVTVASDTKDANTVKVTELFGNVPTLLTLSLNAENKVAAISCPSVQP